MHIYPSTCPYLYSSNFLLFIINPQHQPFIKSITIIYHSVVTGSTKIKCNNYKSQQTPPIIFWKRNQKRRKTSLHCSRILLLILPSTILLPIPPFNTTISLAIHCLLLICSTSNTNKQNFLPKLISLFETIITTTNK